VSLKCNRPEVRANFKPSNLKSKTIYGKFNDAMIQFHREMSANFVRTGSYKADCEFTMDMNRKGSTISIDSKHDEILEQCSSLIKQLGNKMKTKYNETLNAQTEENQQTRQAIVFPTTHSNGDQDTK
jgi:hypothetical protein